MISNNDQLLMDKAGSGNGPIQSNSQYDTTIDFNDDPNQEPGSFSPRPDPNEAMPDTQFIHDLGNGGTLSDFQVDFRQNMNSINNHANNGNNMMMMNNINDNNLLNNEFNDYSPRPMGTFPHNFGNNNNLMQQQQQQQQMMNAPTELAPLFASISSFQPPPLDISPHFKPFLPDLVPSIGSIDAFIKIPRPDGEQDPLGLVLLDEPSIGCSNPQIMKMQLREKFNVVMSSGGINGQQQGDGYIGFIDKLNGDENTKSTGNKELASFLESYDEISRNRAAPTIAYSYKMPELEELMQFWPEELERAFNSLPLPSAEMDLSLEEFIRVICALLDIPVKGNVVESLHILFTLYQQFKENHYFTNTEGSRGTTPVKNA